MGTELSACAGLAGYLNLAVFRELQWLNSGLQYITPSHLTDVYICDLKMTKFSGITILFILINC